MNVLLSLLLLSMSQAAVFSTNDLLQGSGSFENGGEAGSWVAWNNSGPQGITSTANTGSYGYKLGNATGGSQNIRVQTTVSNMVANRYLSADLYVKNDGSSPSWAKVRFGSLWSDSLSQGWSYSAKHVECFYTEAAGDMVFSLTTYTNSANDGVCFDDVALYREIALPNVDEYNGSEKQWILTNTGGRVGEDSQLIAFDNDVVVSYSSGFDVGEILTTWDSDNQLSIEFGNALEGEVTLEIYNPNGDISTFVTVPEPVTLLIFGAGAVTIFRKRKH